MCIGMYVCMYRLARAQLCVERVGRQAVDLLVGVVLQGAQRGQARRLRLRPVERPSGGGGREALKALRAVAHDGRHDGLPFRRGVWLVQLLPCTQLLLQLLILLLLLLLQDGGWPNGLWREW